MYLAAIVEFIMWTVCRAAATHRTSLYNDPLSTSGPTWSNLVQPRPESFLCHPSLLMGRGALLRTQVASTILPGVW